MPRYISGRSQTMTQFTTCNPATGEKLADYPLMDDATLEGVLADTSKAQAAWRRQSFAERAVRMRKAAEILRNKAGGEFAGLMMREMGKPLAQGKAEAEKCAWICDYYADNAERILSRDAFDTGARKSFVCYEP